MFQFDDVILYRTGSWRQQAISGRGCPRVYFAVPLVLDVGFFTTCISVNLNEKLLFTCYKIIQRVIVPFCEGGVN